METNGAGRLAHGVLLMTVIRANGAKTPGLARPKAETLGRELRTHNTDFAYRPPPQGLMELLTRLEAADRPSELQGRGSASE
jgi:hypothetical protein